MKEQTLNLPITGINCAGCTADSGRTLNEKADGLIFEGHSAMDESMLCGEPVPVDKKADDPVSGGIMNGDRL